MLLDVAGTDATAAYEDVGHSEDADDIMQTYLVGTLKDATRFVRKSAVRVIQPTSVPVAKDNSSSRVGKVAAAGSVAGLLSLLYYVPPRHGSLQLPHALYQLQAYLPSLHRLLPSSMTGMRLPQGGFANGFAAAALLSAIITGIVGMQVSKLTKIDSGFTRYPPRIKSKPSPKADPHSIPGFLNPKDYKTLPFNPSVIE